MDDYVFEDALAKSNVSCTFPGLESSRIEHAGDIADSESLFFPGCSFLNYGMPLVQSVYELLRSGGQTDGISLLCCGKILEYEGDGGLMRADFEGQLRDCIAASGVKRIVAACPNCTYSLRRLLARDEATSAVQVVPLPRVLADMGYRVDVTTANAFARRVAGLPDDDPVVFCPKDSCPDRGTGEFADALRQIMVDTAMAEPKFARKRSYCCGSRPRAAGHYELGDKQARRHGDHAHQAGANVIVTACVSCAFSLWGAGCSVPVFHYLELLFDWPIPWHTSEGYLKLRFLLKDTPAVRSGLDYKGLAG